MTIVERALELVANDTRIGLGSGHGPGQVQDGQRASNALGHLGILGYQGQSPCLVINLSWELDFWGRYRRAVESAEGTLGRLRRIMMPSSSPCWRRGHRLSADQHARTANCTDAALR